MASSSAALVALFVASCAAVASATSFTVGDGQGWVTGVDYSRWTSGKTFAAGDQLVFNYVSKAHTVTEVSQSNFDSCSGSNAISNDDSGSTTVTLNSPGTHYFICTVPGHCSNGMKLAVTVSGTGSYTPTGGAGGGALVPAVSSVVAAAAGALVKLALF